MIDIEDIKQQNIDVATDRRLEDLAEAGKQFRQVEAKGLLPSQLKASAQLVVPANAPLPESAATSATVQKSVATSASLQESGTASESRPAPDPDVAWRYTRLAITAGLVVLLFVIWIWQKKKGR